MRTVAELDQAVQAGRFHEPEAFDDYFRFDYLGDQRHILLDMVGSYDRDVFRPAPHR